MPWLFQLRKKTTTKLGQVKNGKYLLCKITWFGIKFLSPICPNNAEQNSSGKASQRRVSTIKISTNMSSNLSLLTVLFILCYFIKKGRNVVVYTTITRDSNGDYFTNVCNNCYKYGAALDQGVCKCESQSSLFLRSEKRCSREDKFLCKYSGCEAYLVLSFIQRTYAGFWSSQFIN